MPTKIMDDVSNTSQICFARSTGNTRSPNPKGTSKASQKVCIETNALVVGPQHPSKAKSSVMVGILTSASNSEPRIAAAQTPKKAAVSNSRRNTKSSPLSLKTRSRIAPKIHADTFISDSNEAVTLGATGSASDVVE